MKSYEGPLRRRTYCRRVLVGARILLPHPPPRHFQNPQATRLTLKQERRGCSRYALSDEKQRMQLRRDLGLEPRFGFGSKRGGPR
ncbi:homeobox-leucine zipper protein ROC8-like isoform X1 [Iris pallida]|uniref:Homeobox-leucine zipper protein ROC8-like isoform X1 n=1 Tax=Iris pallida TaxID=29817 RepID=A0AAX6G537_IRIPA|nr:homeobox-leucine zipper protein ROC8-like isoform X1 [Iris pallida]